MKKRKLLLMALIGAMMLIYFSQGTVRADTVIQEMTESTSYKDVNFGVTQGVRRTTRRRYDAEASAMFNALKDGGEYWTTRNKMAASPNIYCGNQNISTIGGTYTMRGGIHGGTFADRPMEGWVYSECLPNSGDRYEIYLFSGQKVTWALSGGKEDLTNEEARVLAQAKAYANYGAARVAYQAETGSDYKYPTAVQTAPKSINYLAGPYKIDYMYGEYEGTYIAGIKEMVMKDKDGNVVTYSTKDLGNSARWYMANADGTTFTSGYGPGGNYPKPNQEFYIKVVNFHKSKAYVTFKITKIETESRYISATGEHQLSLGSKQCYDCKNHHCGRFIRTTSYYKRCSGTTRIGNGSWYMCRYGYYRRAHGERNHYFEEDIFCEGNRQCSACRNAHCGRPVGNPVTVTDPKTRRKDN